MEQPMFSLASYHGERKLAWKRICNMISRLKSTRVHFTKIPVLVSSAQSQFTAGQQNATDFT